MSGDGWETIYPKPAPEAVEVELVGGPRDGERLAVKDVDAPLIFALAYTSADDDIGIVSRIVYRRRVVGPDEPEPMPIRFDYARPELV